MDLKIDYELESLKPKVDQSDEEKLLKKKNEILNEDDQTKPEDTNNDEPYSQDTNESNPKMK